MDFTGVTRFLESLSGVGIPGTDLGIYLKGKEVYRHKTGFADIGSQKPIRPYTLYAMWSMTKIITCTAALRLYEEGKYVMTEPLHEYLPEFKDMTYRKTQENGVVEVVACTRPIKIADLFTMSSGLTYETPDSLVNAAKTVKKPDLQAFVAALSKEPLAFEPGTRWHYGLSHDVLGAFVEKLSGESFGTYLQKNIFQPLGMNDTFFGLNIPDKKAGRIASAYTYDDKTKKYRKVKPSPMSGEWSFESGGAGLISGLDDYAKFAIALNSGGMATSGYRLLGNATVKLMRTNHLDDIRMGDYKAFDHLGGYGYGLGVRTMVDRAVGGSNSNIGEFGWAGMLGTFVLMDPAAELTYVYAHQLNPSKEEYVAPRLRNIIYACL